ncbi:SWFGD domain-containing protein [Paracoccus alkenifer]|uniref:SWFGD domain-containing protein n=1 Tax=Paracoccus alkenifer TaxID=65735 RepID=UPI000AFC8BE2|nr:SWFGD domain-containing protein [Paracoccus alkenifer]
MADQWRDEQRRHRDEDRPRAYGGSRPSRHGEGPRPDHGRDDYGPGAYGAQGGSFRRNYGESGDPSYGRSYPRDYAGGYSARPVRDADYGSGYRGYRDRDRDRNRDRGWADYRAEDRGWIERAGDEVASWFGDDDAERRRHMDDLRDEGRSRSDYYSRAVFDRTGGRYRRDW